MKNLKRRQNFSSIVIVTLSLILVLSSCGRENKAVRLRYQAEKALHDAEKFLETTQIKPELVDRHTLKEIADRFGQVADFCYAALDSIDEHSHPYEYREVQHLVFQASSRLSQLYYSQKRYDTCQVILKRLLENTHLDKLNLLTTEINYGQALQASGAWDSALAVYTKALEEFYPPVDDSGQVIFSLFNLPSHIFQVVNMVGDSTERARKFQDAEQYYLRLINDFPGSRVSAAARASLARLYDDTEQWEKEIVQLKAVLDSTETVPPEGVGSSKLPIPAHLIIKMRIADIYGAKLKKLDTALQIYADIEQEVAPTDTVALPLVRFKTAMIKMEQKEYPQARKILVDLKRDFPRFYARTPMAQYALARSFELEGNWSRAETEYTLLIENYRGSEEAMSTYLHIADRYARLGRDKVANRWYTEAEQYFDEIAALNSGTITEAKALSYKADLYRQRGNWERAAQILTELFNRFPQTEPGRRALLRAATIYRSKLNKPKTADSLIEILRASITDVEENTDNENP